ncbi:MAG: hypothetical protein M3Z09_08350 [Acidobacteriota bacterium]|nr:hypothetical protein [Acidobacteriota bacterium]
MDEARSESAHQDVPMGPVIIEIRHTPSELRIETTRTENGQPAAFHEVITYKLDGTESTNTGNAGTPVVAKAHWDGAKLVTETARNVQDSTVTTVYVLSLVPGGREMIIDKSLTVQHGYQFEGARTTGRGKDIFLKNASDGHAGKAR